MDDDRMGDFWNELRRRKVIRVVVVYAVVAWAMIEAASVVFPSLLLPDWALRFLVILALIGFPVAVALAWAFEVRPERASGAGGAAAPQPTTDRPAPEGESRLEGWKRIANHLNRDVRTVRRWEKSQGLPVRRLMHEKQATVYAFESELDEWVARRDAPPGDSAPTAKPPARRRVPMALGAIAVIALTAWWFVAQQSRSSVSLGDQDWVLITQFENRTGDDLFEDTVEYALARELNNSRIVKVAPRERVSAALALMKRPPDTTIDRQIGREVSLRDGGIRLLITGRIDKLGDTFLFSVDLVNPTNDVTLASFAQPSAGEDEILGDIGILASDVREALGDRIRALPDESERLLKATTTSLEALRLYTQADQLMRSEERDKAAGLLESAVRIDPDFASAHLLLVYLLREQGATEALWHHLERAVELANPLPERERLFILATYYRYLDDPKREIETYELLLRLHPDHRWARGNLARTLDWQGRPSEAMTHFQLHADQNPNDIFLQYLAAMFSGFGGEDARRDEYLARTEALDPFPWLRTQLLTLPAKTAWVEGDLDRALTLTNGLIANMTREELLADGILFTEVRHLFLTLGRLEQLRELSAMKPETGWFDAVADWHAGQPRTLENYLDQGTVSYWNALLLSLSGNHEASRAMIDSPGIDDTVERGATIIDWKNLAIGQLALADGEYEQAVARLDDDFYMHFFPRTRHAQQVELGLLAEAYVGLGEQDKAIATLERGRAQRESVISAPGAAWFWLENLRTLAELYESTGQPEAATLVYGELEAMLSVADRDHPMRRD